MTIHHRTYWTFIGNRDPWPAGAPGQEGAALNLLDDLIAPAAEGGKGVALTEVVVAFTPNARPAPGSEAYSYAQRCEDFTREVRRRVPRARVTPLKLTSRPNDGRALLREITSVTERFKRDDVELHVNLSSGTPQMIEVMQLLRTLGHFGGARVHGWQVHHPEYRDGGARSEEAALPYVQEVLRLRAAFASLRRYSFARAAEEFDTLTRVPLEVRQREALIEDFAMCADALQQLEFRQYARAHELLSSVRAHVPSLAALRDFADALAREDEDARVWEAWARFDRYRDRKNALEGVLWARMLLEVAVVALLKRAGLRAEKKFKRADNPEVFDRLARHPEVGQYRRGGVFEVYDYKRKLQVLEALNALPPERLRAFTEDDPAMDELSDIRNRIVHRGDSAYEDDLELAERVARAAMRAYPFESTPYAPWVESPALCPLSSAHLNRLFDELEDLAR